MDCVRVVEQISIQFFKKNPYLNYDDIFSEATNAMAKALETHNPNRERTLASWTGFIVHRELNKAFKTKNIEIEYIDHLISNNTFNPERITVFKNTLENLSEASKAIIEIILEDSIPDHCENKNQIKREIKNKLRRKGFAWNKIQKAFSELREYANTV